jgi:hypothetical protein
MTENERDAGDKMAKLLDLACNTIAGTGEQIMTTPETWARKCRKAVKAWEDAKNEDSSYRARRIARHDALYKMAKP